MTKTLSILVLSLSSLRSYVLGYQAYGGSNKNVFSRRNILATAASAAAAALVATPTSVKAADEDPLVPVYFGVGVSLRRTRNADYVICPHRVVTPLTPKIPEYCPSMLVFLAHST